MRYVNYMHAAQAAITLRQITGLTYKPFPEKSGGYDLKANLSYPVVARDPSTVYLTRSIVPTESSAASSRKPFNNGAFQHQSNNFGAKSSAANVQIARPPQTNALQNGVNGTEGNSRVQTPTPAPQIRQKSLSYEPSVTIQNGNTHNATGPNPPQADVPPPPPVLPVGRVAIPVFAPQFQAGTGKATNATSTPSGTDGGNLAGATGGDKSFDVTAPISNYGAGNVLVNAGLVAGVNNVSQSSRIGLIVDRVAG